MCDEIFSSPFFVFYGSSLTLIWLAEIYGQISCIQPSKYLGPYGVCVYPSIFLCAIDFGMIDGLGRFRGKRRIALATLSRLEEVQRLSLQDPD